MVEFEQVSLSFYESLMRLRGIVQPQILELQNFISNFISLCNVVPYYCLSTDKRAASVYSIVTLEKW